MYNNDPLKDFYRRDKAQTDWENALPICCRCKHPIQDETYYRVDGKNYCTECMNDEFQVTNFEY